MRILVAGASGAIGRPLLARLVAAGHEVVGLTRSERGAEAVRAAGAEPLVQDALDLDGLRRAAAAARPEALVNQLTEIPARFNPRTMDRDFARNDRLRGEAGPVLTAAAREAGARRVVSQSIAFAYAPRGERIVGEDAPLYLDARPPWRRSVKALDTLERATREAGGVVLRYGFFYGPGTAYARDGTTAEDVRRRRLPIVGAGSGLFSFVHVDDAAEATVAALGHEGAATFNVVDDEPAPMSEWLPAYAEAIGAPRPLRIPALLARLVAGRHLVEVATAQRGASNARARDRLGWAPAHAGWREGFRAAL